MPTPEENLRTLGITLPTPPEAKGNYLPARRVGDLLYLSGVLPIADGKVACTGAVGGPRTIEEGYAAARLCVLNALANIRAAVGSLDAVEAIVMVNGFVQGVAGFAQSPQVVNGASDLLAAVFGEAGRHARAAVAVAGLPLDAAVEIQIICQLKPGA